MLARNARRYLPRSSSEPNSEQAFLLSDALFDFPADPTTAGGPIADENDGHRRWPDVLFSNYAHDVFLVCALDSAIQLVVVEVDTFNDVSEAKKAIDLIRIIVIKADEDTTLCHGSAFEEAVGAEERSRSLPLGIDRDFAPQDTVHREKLSSRGSGRKLGHWPRYTELFNQL